MKLPLKEPLILNKGIYKIDPFNLEPIFSVYSKNNNDLMHVRSWEEAFNLHGDVFIKDINPSYVASLITNNHTISHSPYLRIKRIPKSNFIEIKNNNSIERYPYDPFKNKALSLEEKELYKKVNNIFRNKLEEITKISSENIGCELSSGLDSNAVVGALTKGLDIDPKRIYTWSAEGIGEDKLIKNFLKFHKINVNNTLLEKTEYLKRDNLQSYKENLLIYGMPPQLHGYNRVVRHFKNCKCEIMFSGFGGDQGISHNGNNIGTDLIKDFDLIGFFNWMNNPFKSSKGIIGRTYGLLNNEWKEKKFSKNINTYKANNPLIKFLTDEGGKWLLPHIQDEIIFEADTYSPIHESIKNRCMSEWVSLRMEEEIRMASHYGIKKFFPLLDTNLISTLLNQNPKSFGRKYGQGRLIHRKAFSNYLPEYLRIEPSKFREVENEWEIKMKRMEKNILEDLILFSYDWNPNLSKYWDLKKLQDLALSTLDNINQLPITENSIVIKSLRNINKLSCWFSELE